MNIRLHKKWERKGPRAILAIDLNGFQNLRDVVGPTKGFLRNLMRQIKSSLKMRRWVKREYVANGGWHFTWLGGSEAVAVKGSSLSVHSHLPQGQKTVSWAEDRMENALKNEDIFELVDVDLTLPKFVRENKEVYGTYML